MAHASEQGSDHAAQLHALLQPMASYSADFEQVVMGTQGRRLQTLTGEIRLQRPGKFRWEVAAPYPQLIVTDGERLFVYDPDLEQVLVQPLENALAGTPALLLTEETADIEALFHVFHAPHDADDDDIFVLTPKDSKSLFREIRLHFAATILAAIDIIDHLDQITRITFTNATLDPMLESALFDFDVPPGTDVIGDVPDRIPAG